MNQTQYEFTTKPAALRQALACHREWLEIKLETSLSEAVIFEIDLDLTEIGIEKILVGSSMRKATSKLMRRLSPLVTYAETPPGTPPLVNLSNAVQEIDLRKMLLTSSAERHHNLRWADCPIAMRLDGIDCTIIAINVSYHAGPSCDDESMTRLIVARRNCAAQIVRLIENLDQRDSQPRLHTHRGASRRIANCDWDQLVLDPNVISLLKDDFESFFERETWFHEMRLPFRRGYLLHGPPGNGKSSAIRAMMTSRGLSAYTLRLFDQSMDDSNLDSLFDTALKHRPAMVLLEDLDRAFPKTGESKSRISLQQLLNCLDGVGTGEGIIVVATANEPTILDPAILRRPGRFDRVVHFPNPSRDLRKEYFLRINPAFDSTEIEDAVTESGGFSFAQIREAYIMAGQCAFKRDGEITGHDLLSGVHSLHTSMAIGSHRNNSAGFRPTPSIEVTI